MEFDVTSIISIIAIVMSACTAIWAVLIKGGYDKKLAGIQLDHSKKLAEVQLANSKQLAEAQLTNEKTLTEFKGKLENEHGKEFEKFRSSLEGQSKGNLWIREKRFNLIYAMYSALSETLETAEGICAIELAKVTENLEPLLHYWNLASRLDKENAKEGDFAKYLLLIDQYTKFNRLYSANRIILTDETCRSVDRIKSSASALFGSALIKELGLHIEKKVDISQEQRDHIEKRIAQMLIEFKSALELFTDEARRFLPDGE
jgi:hypothetical protein